MRYLPRGKVGHLLPFPSRPKASESAGGCSVVFPKKKLLFPIFWSLSRWLPFRRFYFFQTAGHILLMCEGFEPSIKIHFGGSHNLCQVKLRHTPWNILEHRGEKTSFKHSHRILLALSLYCFFGALSRKKSCENTFSQLFWEFLCFFSLIFHI